MVFVGLSVRRSWVVSRTVVRPRPHDKQLTYSPTFTCFRTCLRPLGHAEDVRPRPGPRTGPSAPVRKAKGTYTKSSGE